MSENNGLNRGLSARHLSMIAIGGSIGTGLFIASGGAIHQAGPVGALLAYVLMALLVYFMMMSLGEMSAYRPTSGSFCDHGREFVGPTFGKTMSVNYYFNWASCVAVELSAAAMIMQYWFPHSSALMWITLFFVLIGGMNFLTVRFYGELESCLSLIKVIAILAFLVVGALLVGGVIGHPSGSLLQHWSTGHHGFHGGWTAALVAFVLASFSFQGVELVGVAAGEVKDAQRSVPRAVRQVFWRMIIFYLLTIVVIGSLIHYTDPHLLSSDAGQITQSPFTIILSSSGLHHVASLMNFVILIAVLSAANSDMYSASRILFSMAKAGDAPSRFTRVARNGVPILAVLLTALIGAVVFVSGKFGNGVVFMWLVNISTLSGVVAWLGIMISHMGFRRHLRQQGISVDSLSFRARGFPWGQGYAFLGCMVVIIGQVALLISQHQLSPVTLASTYALLPILGVIGLWDYYRRRRTAGAALPA